MRMRLKNGTPSGIPGEAVSLFGYAGVVNDQGVAVVDVPDAFVDLELEAGRLVALEEEGAIASGNKPPATPNLDKMKVKDLRGYAASIGIEIPEEMTSKADIIAYLQERTPA